MTSGWLRTLRIAVTAISVALFAAGAHIAATELIDLQRSRQINEINDVALRRAEVAVHYGDTTLSELIKQTPISCDSAALQALRLDIYQRWGVKDIRIANRDGSVACSAYPETLEFDKEWPQRDLMLPARDLALRLFRVEQLFGNALGVFKDIDETNALIAILTVNASLFDIMPGQLRDHSKVTLELANGQTIADYISVDGGSLTNAVEFVKTSEQYPLRAVIRIDTAAYGHWHRESYLPILTLGLALGLGFGLLLASAVARPRSPIAAIDRALAAREFRPYLQPVFDLQTNKITGCEVLARWVQRDGTIVPPARFIPLAESSGRIATMTWQLLAEALTELRELLARDKTFKMSINIAASHLLATSFVSELRRIVGEARVSPRQIEIEITEREELPDLDRAAGVVAALRDHGFKVAIDDVGIGHSGLSHIQRLGASTLKIDKFFVDSVSRDASAVTVIEMLVRLSEELQMSVVAEGIETAEQVAALINCGVVEGQGYVFAPPLAASDFVALATRHAEAAAHSQGAVRAA